MRRYAGAAIKSKTVRQWSWIEISPVIVLRRRTNRARRRRVRHSPGKLHFSPFLFSITAPFATSLSRGNSWHPVERDESIGPTNNWYPPCLLKSNAMIVMRAGRQCAEKRRTYCYCLLLAWLKVSHAGNGFSAKNARFSITHCLTGNESAAVAPAILKYGYIRDKR